MMKFICRKCGCVSYAKSGSNCQRNKRCSNCIETGWGGFGGRGENKGKPSKYRIGWTKVWKRDSKSGRKRLEAVHVRDHVDEK